MKVCPTVSLDNTTYKLYCVSEKRKSEDSR